MKTTWKNEWPHWMLLAVMFALAAWMWPLTGDKIPVHWNGSGEIDRYGGKIEGLLLLPLISLGVYGLLLVVPRLDPGRANYAQFAKSYHAIRLSVIALNFAVYCAILLATAGYRFDMPGVISVLTGASFIVLGGVMGKIRPNWFVGIRTPWTISSKTAWVKTHRVGGWTFIALGVVQIAAGMLFSSPSALFLTMLLILSATVGLSLYSYLVWRNADDKVPPAGTLPADTITS